MKEFSGVKERFSLFSLSLLAGAVGTCGWEEQPAERGGSRCAGWVPGAPEGRAGVSSGLCGLCWLLGCSKVSLADWRSVLLGECSCITLGLLFFITSV